MELMPTNPLFHPVQVSKERIIRQVTGLRPFRPSGFVLMRDRLDEKVLVHNYGHGGGGISLSWGTAKMAADLACETGATSFAVLGAGVIGISTARMLQRRGGAVTIYSRELPPETTSNVAGALWAPVSAYEPDKVNEAFLQKFNLASKISQRMFQDFVGDKYGVNWIRNYYIGNTFDFPGGKELYPGQATHRDPKIYFGYPEVTEINTMLIQPPIYLNALIDDFYKAGGTVRVTDFQDANQIAGLPESVIVNCTGLGSAKLFNDKELMPEKGQLTILLPQPEIDYAYIVSSPENYLYMFPRKDGIVLGGTHDKGNWSLEPDPVQRERILKGHQAIAASLPAFKV